MLDCFVASLLAMTGFAIASGLYRSARRLGPPQMLVEPRQDLNEIAGLVAVVELVHENLVEASLQAPGEPGRQNM